MVDVKTDITIRCPIQKVAEYAADPDHAPEWYVNIDSAEWRTEKPLSVHSQIAFKARFLGKDLSYVYEIKEFVPGQKLVMKTANGPFPMETTYEWESIDGQTTKMTLRNQGDPIGFSRVMMPLMSVMMKKANKKDLMKIKEILENS
ncbi:SRPBCC family protein [Rossellomorea aquimaris]|uniref:SRPBCC family protein n=1 Tax=Rossellomorea aquimaris TaxID=189382 RepID=UPI001CFE1F2A|nr:SRPBCC family protein [Rossellomorea aquimaris]